MLPHADTGQAIMFVIVAGEYHLICKNQNVQDIAQKIRRIHEDNYK